MTEPKLRSNRSSKVTERCNIQSHRKKRGPAAQFRDEFPNRTLFYQKSN